VKTELSRRVLALPAIVVDALRTQRDRQNLDRMLAGARWQETGFVFTTAVGTPMDGSRVTREFQALLRRAGLPHMRFYDLRHGCASLLLAQGVHPRVVMETLGHSSIALTMNTYSHVSRALQAEAAVSIDEALRGKGVVKGVVSRGSGSADPGREEYGPNSK
jgi:integrase